VKVCDNTASMNHDNLPLPVFSNRADYLSYCSGVASSLSRDIPTPLFDLHRKAITAGGTMVIPTSWGGVHILSYEHPEVEKFLVIDKGRFLAFEKHAEKVETLLGEEGLGVLVYRCEESGQLKAEAINPGWTRTLQPGQEHTIIALSNLLVRERSTDPRGMDNDLIFIFLPDGLA
jgi:hypothetical protein